jgi:hypothetical protein
MPPNELSVEGFSMLSILIWIIIDLCFCIF